MFAWFPVRRLEVGDILEPAHGQRIEVVEPPKTVGDEIIVAVRPVNGTIISTIRYKRTDMTNLDNTAPM